MPLADGEAASLLMASALAIPEEAAATPLEESFSPHPAMTRYETRRAALRIMDWRRILGPDSLRRHKKHATH